jgi:hypothetical protein
MEELKRRAVLIGAGVLAGAAAAPFLSATPARGEPDPNDAPDLALLRRTFVLADEARQSGGLPTERWSPMPRAR